MIQNYKYGQRFKDRSRSIRHLINERIYASQLRMIDSKGTQLGVMSRGEALQKAQDEGLDLVLIAPKAVPPVAKLIEYSKFLYQEAKRLKEAKKGAKKSDIKNIKLSLFIGPADLERMRGKAKEFTAEGHQVRVSLLLKGREVGKRNMGFDVINGFINSVEGAGVSSHPKIQGRMIWAVISKKGHNEKKGEN